MQIEIDRQVRQLLESRRGEWGAIALKADVSHSWISKFVRGQIPNPGYATLKRLRTALTGRASRAVKEAA